MKKTLSKAQVIGLILVALLAPGCIGPRTVNVIANEDICNKTVEVHLVGVNWYEKEQWETMSMTDYWEPENKKRKSAKSYTYVIKFGQGQSTCKITLPKKDPVREEWKKRKAEYLFILADISGLFDDMSGNKEGDYEAL